MERLDLKLSKTSCNKTVLYLTSGGVVMAVRCCINIVIHFLVFSVSLFS